MSAHTDTQTNGDDDADGDDAYTMTELLAMDKAEAVEKLDYGQYQTWESAVDHHDRYHRQKQKWRTNETEATDILVRADVGDLATELTLFGNQVSVYYDPEDPRIRDLVERLGDLLGVDTTDPTAIEASAADIDESAIDPAKELLAEFIAVTIQRWDGVEWDDIPSETRSSITDQIQQPHPDGWGLVGLMDGLNDILVAVESNRDDRLERVQKFRQPERRGDR